MTAFTDEEIDAAVQDIQHHSGAWSEFSLLVKKSGTGSLQERMESAQFKSDVKRLFEAADTDQTGFLEFGNKKFNVFLNSCIDEFGLPKPKTKNLGFEKLFKRFSKEQHLDLDMCQKMIEGLATMILKVTFPEPKPGDELVQDISLTVEDIEKNSSAWADFSRRLNKEHAEALQQQMDSPAFFATIKRFFAEADPKETGFLVYGRESFTKFLQSVMVDFNLPEPSTENVGFRKLFNRFSSDSKMNYDACEKLVRTMGCVIMRMYDLDASTSATKELLARIQTSSNVGVYAEFKSSMEKRGFIASTREELLGKLKREEIKQMFDSEAEQEGQLSWQKGEVVRFMQKVLDHFNFPRPTAGEIAYYKMFKAAAQPNARFITFQESMTMITSFLSVAVSAAEPK